MRRPNLVVSAKSGHRDYQGLPVGKIAPDKVRCPSRHERPLRIVKNMRDGVHAVLEVGAVDAERLFPHLPV